MSNNQYTKENNHINNQGLQGNQQNFTNEQACFFQPDNNLVYKSQNIQLQKLNCPYQNMQEQELLDERQEYSMESLYTGSEIAVTIGGLIDASSAVLGNLGCAFSAFDLSKSFFNTLHYNKKQKNAAKTIAQSIPLFSNELITFLGSAGEKAMFSEMLFFLAEKYKSCFESAYKDLPSSSACFGVAGAALAQPHLAFCALPFFVKSLSKKFYDKYQHKQQSKDRLAKQQELLVNLNGMFLHTVNENGQSVEFTQGIKALDKTFCIQEAQYIDKVQTIYKNKATYGDYMRLRIASFVFINHKKLVSSHNGSFKLQSPEMSLFHKNLSKLLGGLIDLIGIDKKDLQLFLSDDKQIQLQIIFKYAKKIPRSA